MATIHSHEKHATPQAKHWRSKKVQDAWQRELFLRSCAAIRVGIVLARHMNCARGGYAWLLRKTLMEGSRIKRLNHVSRALTELEKEDLITRYVYGPELARVFTVRLKCNFPQTVYVVHDPRDAFEIRNWHEKRGIPRRSESSPRRAKHRVTKTPPKPFEVISFTGKTKESPQSG